MYFPRTELTIFEFVFSKHIHAGAFVQKTGNIYINHSFVALLQ